MVKGSGTRVTTRSDGAGADGADDAVPTAAAASMLAQRFGETVGISHRTIVGDMTR